MKSWMQMLRADKQFSDSDIVGGVCDAYPRGKDDDDDDDIPDQTSLVYPSEAFTVVMNTPFDSGFGSTTGARFTVWTKTRVFFPVCYDGAEWAGSAPRHPTFEVTAHVGGG